MSLSASHVTQSGTALLSFASTINQSENWRFVKVKSPHSTKDIGLSFDGLNSSYLVRLHPDLADSLHSWNRKWSWWARLNLAQSPDQVKIDVIVFEARPNFKLLSFLDSAGYRWPGTWWHNPNWVGYGRARDTSKLNEGFLFCSRFWDHFDHLGSARRWFLKSWIEVRLSRFNSLSSCDH